MMEKMILDRCVTVLLLVLQNDRLSSTFVKKTDLKIEEGKERKGKKTRRREKKKCESTLVSRLIHRASLRTQLRGRSTRVRAEFDSEIIEDW